MEEQIFTAESILYGAVGTGVGFAIGLFAKKAFNILFKLTLFFGAVFVGALVYLQSKEIILINERALDNIMNETFTTINDTIGQQAIDNPIRFVLTSLGVPMTSGIGLGLLMGWMRG